MDSYRRNEVIDMLEILQENAIADGAKTTLINDVSISSFQWVIDEAIQCLREGEYEL